MLQLVRLLSKLIVIGNCTKCILIFTISSHMIQYISYHFKQFKIAKGTFALYDWNWIKILCKKLYEIDHDIIIILIFV